MVDLVMSVLHLFRYIYFKKNSNLKLIRNKIWNPKRNISYKRCEDIYVVYIILNARI